MGGFSVREGPHSQDLKGVGTSKTSALTRGLIGVIQTSSHQVGATKTPPWIMAVGFVSNSKLDGLVRKKGHWEDDCIGFTVKDLKDVLQPHENALVIMLQVRGFDVRMVLINQGSRVEIIYPDLYVGLGLTPEDLASCDSLMVAFYGIIVMPARQVTLPEEVEERKVMVNFIVVHSYFPYTAILGRPWIHAMGAIPSSLHQKVKFSTKHAWGSMCSLEMSGSHRGT